MSVICKKESTSDSLTQLALFKDKLINNLNLNKCHFDISARQRATPNLPDYHSFDLGYVENLDLPVPHQS
jgi:hypothetical protein